MHAVGTILALELHSQGQIFLVLIFSVAVLFFLALFFAFLTIFLRFLNIRKAARWSALEAKWEPDLLKVLSGELPAAGLWKRVEKEDRLYFVDFLLRYARRFDGKERALLSKTAGPFLKQVVKGISQGDPERCARAIHTVGFLGLEPCSAEIIAALDDPSPLVAMSAARALVRNANAHYAETVAAKLDRFKLWDPRFLASILSRSGPELAAALRKILGDPRRSLWSRTVSAEALRELSDFAAADTAVSLLEKESDRGLLSACLDLLGSVGSPEHRGPVLRLCTASDSSIRAQAVRALGRLGGSQEITQLRRALEDPSPWVAIQAAWSLKEAGAIEILREIVASQHPRAGFARQALMERAW